MSILVYNKIILYPFYIGIFWYISYLALLSNKFLCRILWDLKWIRIAYTLSLNYIIDITEMVTTSNGPDLMKAKRVNTFKRTLLLLSSRTKNFILLPLHSFYPPISKLCKFGIRQTSQGKKDMAYYDIDLWQIDYVQHQCTPLDIWPKNFIKVTAYPICRVILWVKYESNWAKGTHDT